VIKLVPWLCRSCPTEKLPTEDACVAQHVQAGEQYGVHVKAASTESHMLQGHLVKGRLPASLEP
jgi:hypothetical protein